MHTHALILLYIWIYWRSL